MSTRCREVRERFSERYDVELSADDETAVREHLDACRDCHAVWERFAGALGSLRGGAPGVPVARGSRGAVVRRFPRAIPRTSRSAVAWAIAASLLAAVSALLPRALVTRPSADGSSGCVEPLFALWSVDVAGFRSAPPEPGGERVLDLGDGRVALPAAFVSRGPYLTETSMARRSGATVCVPLLAPYGDVLVLSVGGPASGADGTPRASTDPARVSYARVRWTQEGRTFVLEGRATEDRLLALAGELGRARATREASVPRPQPGRPPLRAGYEASLSRPLGTRSRGML